MAAISVSQHRVNIGKAAEFTALRKELKPIAAKHGLNLRLFVSLLAGPNVGIVTTTLEAADLAAVATGLQNMFADPAYQEINNRTIGADGVATLISLGTANEIDL